MQISSGLKNFFCEGKVINKLDDASRETGRLRNEGAEKMSREQR
jgi:hypothetical protein